MILDQINLSLMRTYHLLLIMELLAHVKETFQHLYRKASTVTDEWDPQFSAGKINSEG